MSYRPITDVWILARPKVKYYGAYPNGFLERARRLLPACHDVCLHVCGGRAKDYPTWQTLCPDDVTCDVNPALQPDVVWDVTKNGVPAPVDVFGAPLGMWDSILIDPPYTLDDAAHYGTSSLPKPNELLRDALEVLTPGGRVGMLHYVWPQPPKIDVKAIACVAVICGFNNRMRCFSVFERTGNYREPGFFSTKRLEKLAA